MADQPRRPGPAVLALVELTESALTDGIEAAVRHALTVLELERVEQAPPDLRILLEVAIESARRAVAARDLDTAHVTRLRAQARIDDLTGVLNRRGFFERLDDELALAVRSGSSVTLVLCDVDGLKAVNDSHGHPAGDAALRSLAASLEANVRSSDSVGRVGGDEFGLILVGADARHDGRVLARLIRNLDSGTAMPGGTTASFGMARAPDDGATCEELVAIADRRLYEHKREERGRAGG